jgi:hypothetical protein
VPELISRRVTPVAAAIVIVGLTGSCKPRAGSETATGRTDTAAMTMDSSSTMAGGMSDTAGAGGKLSDANIVALLDEANMAIALRAPTRLPRPPAPT